MRWFTVFLILLAFSVSTSANAAVVYNIDLNETGFSRIPINPGCYCYDFGGTYTQVFQFQTAGVVDFGHLTISPDIFGTPDDLFHYVDFLTGIGPQVYYGAPPGNVPSFPTYPSYPIISAQCLPNDTACIQTNSASPTYDLVFAISGPTSIQLAWLGGNYEYVAPVPEPSTWAMMILGFAGLCFAAQRRSNKSAKLRVA
jgi:PEP-CTERM motif